MELILYFKELILANVVLNIASIVLYKMTVFENVTTLCTFLYYVVNVLMFITLMITFFIILIIFINEKLDRYEGLDRD